MTIFLRRSIFAAIVLDSRLVDDEGVAVFAQEDVDKVLKENQITRTVAEKLLTLYVGEADWWPNVGQLYKRLERKHGTDAAKPLIRKAVSFTILLPAFDRTTKIDRENPSNLLFWGVSYHQFDSRDWFAELKKVIRRDQQITEWRREVLKSGIIDAIEYQPYSRQGYKWLCGKAKETDVDLTPELKQKFRQLVLAYGGAVTSHMFESHSDVINKIVNWRSGYFFERAIFNCYSLDQVLKIKKNEMEKTNPKWIKTIR